MPTIELKLTEVREGSVSRFEREGSGIVVVCSGGRVHAYRDRCPHAFWPLSEGILRESVLECPGHGWEFDIATGQCLTTPGYCLSPVTVTTSEDSAIFQWSDLDSRSGSATNCIATSRSRTS